MRPQPLIAVKDVEASSRWYQRLLGCRSAHGGREYERDCLRIFPNAGSWQPKVRAPGARSTSSVS